MSKLNKALRAIGIILRKPSMLNLVLDDDGVKKKYVSRKYGFPNGLPQADINGFLPQEGMQVEPFAFLDGGCQPTDLMLLKAVCLRNKVKDYLEIGTWRGESVANVAATGADCVTVNLPDEAMRKAGMTEDYISMHRFFSEKFQNIKHIQADSRTFDFSSLNRKFDLIFIDGDHHTESIAKDSATAFGLLKDGNSVIVWHDYAFSPETPRYEVLAGILDGCPETERSRLFHISNTMCAIYTNERLNTRPLRINERPGHYFSVKMDVIPGG
jgi:predicted O-methyltransferase YrrM